MKLSAHTPIIFSILDGASKLAEKGAGSRFIAMLTKADFAAFKKEAESIVAVSSEVIPWYFIQPEKAVINSNGLRIRVVYEPFLPLNHRWVVKEPDTCCDILNTLYAKPLMDRAMEMPIEDVCEELRRMQLEAKGNTP
jgi:citrate lyase synthetase